MFIAFSLLAKQSKKIPGTGFAKYLFAKDPCRAQLAAADAPTKSCSSCYRR
jgi:hypothetical protein